MKELAFVTYKVKKEYVEENKSLTKKVIEKLNEISPVGFYYASTISEDGQTFTHIALTTKEEMKKYLVNIEEFKRFRENLEDRCEVNPEVKFSSVVGSYKIFDHE